MKQPFEVVGPSPVVEAWELEETITEGDLALAESILARLLVRHWTSQRQAESPQEGPNSLDINGPLSPHVAGHG